jgi:hypothetical protein
MVDRLNKPLFAGSPTFVQSIAVRGSTNAVFAGVAQVNSGASTATVLNVDIRSESVVFLGSQFVPAANSGFGRPFGVTSLTVAAGSGTGAFMVTTCDSLGAGATTRVPFMIWRAGPVTSV